MPLGQNLSEGMTSGKDGLAAKYCSKLFNDAQIVGFFGVELHKENLHFRVANLKVQGFHMALTKTF